MIAFITGTIDTIREDHILLDHDGMGYRIFVSGSFIRAGKGIGDQVKLYTHFSVREDAMQLYGFLTLEEVDIFRMLLNVSGVGPKAAMGILSALTVDELRFAVLSDDTATISRAPGIGKKTAGKLILELKDKFDLQEAFEAKLEREGKAVSAEANAAQQEAVEALTALGYSGAEALQAVRKVEGAEKLSTEELLKQALRFIF